MNRQCEYQHTLDSLHFTPEQKSDIARRALQAAQEQQSRTRRPIRRTVLIAAALAGYSIFVVVRKVQRRKNGCGGCCGCGEGTCPKSKKL